MAAATTKVGKVKAKQAAVVTAGARPPMFEKRIVRDRHSGKLMEIDMNPEVPHRRGRPGSQLRLHQRRGSSRGSRGGHRCFRARSSRSKTETS